MEDGASISRKFYVVIADSSAMQRDLERVLLDGRYSVVSSEYANIYIEEKEKEKERNRGEGGQDRTTMSPRFDSNGVNIFMDSLGVERDLWRSTLHEIQGGGIEPTTLDPSSVETKNNCLDDSWRLDMDRKELGRYELIISLTSIESALINTLAGAEARFVSKEDLIRSIGREPEHYRGLEMSLSRLQGKFKRASGGERLVRAVRNQGYCLIQSVSPVS